MLMDFKIGEDGFLIDRFKSNANFPIKEGFTRLEVSDEIYNEWKMYKYINGEFIRDESSIISEVQERELEALDKEMNLALADAIEFTYNKETYYYKCNVESIQTLILYKLYLEENFHDNLIIDVLDNAGYPTYITADNGLITKIIKNIVLSRTQTISKFSSAHTSIKKANSINNALIESYEL